MQAWAPKCVFVIRCILSASSGKRLSFFYFQVTKKQDFMFGAESEENESVASGRVLCSNTGYD